MVSFGGRLREERVRVGLNQTEFGELAGVTKKTQMLYEADERAPDSRYLSAVAEAGVDVLYVLTGQRSGLPDLTHSSSALASWEIDVQRLARIVEMLEAAARVASRKWPARELVSVAVEIYNALGNERELDEPKVERILKLVVNR